jgi:CBS domain containing-hemolysin-like protein
MTELAILIPTMIFLLLVKGFFSGSEIALVSSNKLKLKTAAVHGNRGARLVLTLFQKPESLLATTLIGTNVATMSLTVLGTVTMIETFGSGGDILSILILTPIMLIFGEIVPKSVFQQHADTIAPIVIRPLGFLRGLFFPLIFCFSWIAKAIVKKLGPEGTMISPYATRQQLRLMLESVDKGTDERLLDRDRIRRAILLSDMTVGEAMIPLAQVDGAPKSISMSELLALSQLKGHRRIPLYEGNISNITSVASWTIWEELASEFLDKQPGEVSVEAHFASKIQRLDELLPVLISRTDHMAIAVDEFGTAVGIVTLEDLMTILLGDVSQRLHLGPSMTESSSVIKKEKDGVYIMNAQTRLAEVAELLDIELPTREFHSLGGLLTSNLRHIPNVNDSIEESGYRFTVIEGNQRAPTLIRVNPL